MSFGKPPFERKLRLPPAEIAPALLDEYLSTGEGYLLDNADPDDLREMLRLARRHLLRPALPLAAEEALLGWVDDGNRPTS